MTVPPRQLTERQKEVLVAIVGLAGELGRLPTWREIGARCGCSHSCVSQFLCALEHKGWVCYPPRTCPRSDSYAVCGFRLAPTLTDDAAGDALRGVLGAGAPGPRQGPGAIEED